MTGVSASEVPGPTGSGQGSRANKVNTRVQRSFPVYAAATAERRFRVFTKTLAHAAHRVSPAQYQISTGAAAARIPAAFLGSAERNRYRLVLKASARGRRVS